jgi:hypothetical protein
VLVPPSRRHPPARVHDQPGLTPKPTPPPTPRPGPTQRLITRRHPNSRSPNEPTGCPGGRCVSSGHNEVAKPVRMGRCWLPTQLPKQPSKPHPAAKPGRPTPASTNSS